MFNRIGDGYVALAEVFLRSRPAVPVLGRRGPRRSAAAWRSRAIGRGMVVGDDALISGGVWMRNYDMHAMHDLRTGARINRPPLDTVLERHVWLGQDALLLELRAGRHGLRSSARVRWSRGWCRARVVAAGTPARVMREGVSWGRHPYGMSAAERRVASGCRANCRRTDRGAACCRPCRPASRYAIRLVRTGYETLADGAEGGQTLETPEYLPHIDLLLQALRINRERLNSKSKIAIDARLLRGLIQAIAARAPFSEEFYLQTYPDIAEAHAAGTIPDLQRHYVEAGFFEGRSARRRRSTRPSTPATTRTWARR